MRPVSAKNIVQSASLVFTCTKPAAMRSVQRALLHWMTAWSVEVSEASVRQSTAIALNKKLNTAGHAVIVKEIHQENRSFGQSLPQKWIIFCMT